MALAHPEQTETLLSLLAQNPASIAHLNSHSHSVITLLLNVHNRSELNAFITNPVNLTPESTLSTTPVSVATFISISTEVQYLTHSHPAVAVMQHLFDHFGVTTVNMALFVTLAEETLLELGGTDAAAFDRKNLFCCS